jgi:Tol biopolymer transport system component
VPHSRAGLLTESRSRFGAGDSFLYIVDVDSGTLTRLIVGARPDWSPDGRKIAFQRRDGAIYVVELKDLEHPVRLTDLSSDPLVVDQNPRWSPNGRRIPFHRGSPDRDGDRQIYVMNADGEDQVSLTPFPGNNANPSWSPDGRWIVFNRTLCDPLVLGQHNPNGSELFIIAADGSQEIRITHGACRGPGGTFSLDSTFSAGASWAPGH